LGPTTAHEPKWHFMLAGGGADTGICVGVGGVVVICAWCAGGHMVLLSICGSRSNLPGTFNTYY
jgi:hypothetical protein